MRFENKYANANGYIDQPNGLTLKDDGNHIEFKEIKLLT